jgi:hypothetical protein
MGIIWPHNFEDFFKKTSEQKHTAESLQEEFERVYQFEEKYSDAN